MESESTQSRPVKVLIVEDDANLADCLRSALQKSHEVRLAQSGKQALEKLEGEGDFDLVICDLMMPAMSGIDLFSVIRDRWPNLARRTVFMTGGAWTPVCRRFLGENQNEVLEKPFKLAELRNLIQMVLQREGCRA